MIAPDLNDLIGIPFDKNGFGPEGYSCYGLLVEVFKRFGYIIPVTDIAACACKQASKKEIKNHVDNYWTLTKIITPPTGLIIRSVNSDLHADHVGVAISKRRFIHVYANGSVTVNHISDWKNRILGYYTYDNVNQNS